MLGELHAADPRSVGPYRLLGRLGAGGLGQVYLGRSAGGQRLAIKVIRPELAGDPGFRTRFAREVAVARNVSGPFTAPVVDADAQGATPWLATEYVPGPSLAEAVDDQGPLPAGSVVALAAGLARGLQAIHAAGVVHRDLKPSNVLLAEDGPRVIDFGIWRVAEATAATQSGTVMASPGFMSPEQAEGGEIGPPSDVFSLGAVLTFAATGEGPFGTGSTAALIYRVVHGTPDTTRLPGQIRPLAERCLAKNPAERPTTGDLLAELGTRQFAPDWLPAPLTEVLGRYTQPVPAAASGPADRSRRSRRRLGWVLGGAALVCALIAAGTAAAVTLRSSGARNNAAPPHSAAAKHAPRSASPTAGASSPTTASPTAAPSTGQPSQSPTPQNTATSAVATAIVPSVIGMSQASANSALHAAGIKTYSWTYGCYGSPNISDVFRQSPDAGARVPVTTDEQLYLQATNCNTVPNVAGLELSAAENTLEQAGFPHIYWIYQCLGSPNIDEVVTQSPVAGTSFGENEQVKIMLQADNCS
jgi:eukaryotic-like serine/threonine-protein kinase